MEKQRELAKIERLDFVGDGKKTEYRCCLCTATLIGTRAFRKHCEDLHQGKRYGCDLCPYSANSKERIYDHRLRIHSLVTQVRPLTHFFPVCSKKSLICLALLRASGTSQIKGDHQVWLSRSASPWTPSKTTDANHCVFVKNIHFCTYFTLPISWLGRITDSLGTLAKNYL